MQLLLVLQYIYSMDLTDEELPSRVDTVNMGQIGLLKAKELPADPLIVKVTLSKYLENETAYSLFT